MVSSLPWRRASATAWPGQSGDRPRERVRALDPGAVERDDHVAATQIRLGGRAALGDALDQHAPFPGHGLDAEKGVRHRAAALERAQPGFGGVDRDGEADADVGVAATVAICELMPITRPWASISGPPEFPG